MTGIADAKFSRFLADRLEASVWVGDDSPLSECMLWLILWNSARGLHNEPIGTNLSFNVHGRWYLLFVHGTRVVCELEWVTRGLEWENTKPPEETWNSLAKSPSMILELHRLLRVTIDLHEQAELDYRT